MTNDLFVVSLLFDAFLFIALATIASHLADIASELKRANDRKEHEP